jgi:hypothetical protein
VTLSLLTLLACLIFGRSLASSSKPVTQIVYTSAARYDRIAWLNGGERFPLGAEIYQWDGTQSRKLISEFAASADPDVSFDGTRVLFAGKKAAGDRWQIWEIGLDGTGLRQIISAKEDVVRPLYLPDNLIVYAKRQGNDFRLEERALDGGNPLILFHVPGSALPTDVLRDGRILFESAYPFGGKTPEIYTVYSDGSGVESYRCDHGTARLAARQAPSGEIIFAKDRGLGRFTSPLAHEVAVDIPKGEYAGEIAASSDEWILSRRDESKKTFELATWNIPSRSLTPLLSGGADLIQPRVISSRPIPNRHPSALHDWKFTNLLALNVYTSKYPFPKDSVAAVRLYTMNPGKEPIVLGTSPVEKDGSFYIKAPGDQPLKFELLDRQGRSLKKQDGWMWARGGEQRICVGCHAGPEHAPENAVPSVLLRSTIPTDLTGSAVDSRAGGH